MEASPISLGFAAGDVVIVTGAANGIGRATAIGGAAVGPRVSAWDLDRDGAVATAQSIAAAGGQALALRADVTDGSDVQAALEETLADVGLPARPAGQPGAVPADSRTSKRLVGWRVR
jgi:NAD(P)-dependent dehydrogenase (short-subunit alcohol dehydrogenase family)